MPHPPDPLSDLMARFVEDVLFPRMEQEFDRLAESMRNEPKSKRLPKQGPYKAQRVHKAQSQPKAKTHTPNPAYTYYHMFQIQPTADAEVVAAAYKALAKKHHPDLVQGVQAKKEAESRMKVINAAWDVLGDPVKRKAYDRTIGVAK
jgi:DnaJ-domain-containing protein 1